jgi:hypothetical protein
MTPIRLAFLVAAALGAGSSAARAGDEAPREFVDAPASAFVGASPTWFGLPEVRWLDEGPGEREPTLYTFEDEVRGLFAEEVEAAGGVLEHGDGAPRVLVSGAPAAAELFRTRVADLARALDGRVVVEVSVVRVPAGAPEPRDRDALLALARSTGAEVLFGERMTLRRGETARRESVERRTFVSGVDAEVAEEASIVPTVVNELTTGRRLSVQARPLPSGRVALQVALHLSRPEAPPRRDGASSRGIDLPEVRFLSLAAPLLLAEGEASLARVPDPFGDGSVLVRVAVVQGPAAAQGPWRLGDLRAVAGEAGPEQTYAPPGWIGGDLVPEPAADEGLAERIDAAQTQLTNAGVTFTPLAAGLVALKGGPVTVFEEVFEGALRTGALTRRTLRLDAAKLGVAPWFDPLDGRVTGDVPADAGIAGAPLRLPLRADTPTVLLVGTWRRVVSDLDVEIAQAAVAVQPDVDSHFEGEAVLARLVRSAPGKPPVVEVTHRTCAVLERVQRPAVLRTQVYGRDGSDPGTTLDVLTTAASRAKIAVGRGTPATVRTEGAAAVLDLWGAE